MGAVIFDKNDSEYFSWLNENPNGFVANVPRRIPTDDFYVHRATCKHISVLGKLKNGAFTERQYIKIASYNFHGIMDFIKQNDIRDISYCKSCNPLDFYEEVKKSLFTSQSDRRERLEKAPKKPTFRTITIREFIRNPDVVAETLIRANGYCESCRNAAPFVRTRDESPYLEVHHKKPLSEGGLDTVENTIALCPNCHRREHHGSPKHPA